MTRPDETSATEQAAEEQPAESLAPQEDAVSTTAPDTSGAPAPVVARSTPAAVSKLSERKNPNELEVNVDADGNGSALFPLDVDKIRAVKSETPGRIKFEESHTVTISRITVAGAAVRDGVVTVTVIRK
jgi:hypothetical protein